MSRHWRTAGHRRSWPSPGVRLIDEDGRQVGAHGDADLDLSSGLPHDRLRVLLGRVVGQVQFGLMRTDVARDAGGVAVSVSGEMVLPAAMALRGRLELVPEQLLSLRVHEDRHGGSRQGEATWVDPDRPHLAFPYSRTTPLLLREVLRAPLERPERARCVSTVLWHWTRPGWKTVAGDAVRLPRDMGWVS